MAQVMTNIADIRYLSVQEAERALPAKVSGVVTCVLGSGRPDFYIQAGDAGIYCSNTVKDSQPIALGDHLELQGVTQTGGFARAMNVRSIKRLGQSVLPAPRSPGIAELKSGRWDSLYVEAKGVLRAVFVDSTGRVRVEIVSDGQRLPAQFQNTASLQPTPEIGAEVRLRGVLGVSANVQRQMIQASLRVADGSGLEVLQAAPSDPYHASRRRIADVLSFSPTDLPDQRVKVVGTVMHQIAESSLFVRDESGAAFITGIKLPAFENGDEIEVLGYPALGGYAPSLEDVIARPTGRRGSLEAVQATGRLLRGGTLDSQLVELEATVLSQTSQPEEDMLVLQIQGRVIHARLRDNKTKLAAWAPGSRIRATGICQSVLSLEDMRRGNWSLPEAEILLRTPEDVQLLKPAPWWTQQKLLLLLGSVTLLLLMSATWAWILRRQVAHQTGIIADKLSRQIASEERARIARDMHDTVGARLTQLSLLHDMALADDTLHPGTRGTLSSAATGTHQVAMAMDEIVWALNPRHDHLPALVSYLAHSAREYLEPLGIQCREDIAGDIPEAKVSSRARHEILGMVKECLQNIAKHAHAGGVRLAVVVAEGELRLCLEDDGAAPLVADSAGPGADGLRNVRERALTLGGSFSLSRAQDKTVARVVLPLSNLV
jgi:signal transduction histidine kinase